MKMDYEVTKLAGGRIEAAAELHWYAEAGSYKIRATGLGKTEEEAKKAASLMLGQARAALHVAMIEGVPNRVPETQSEGAHERSGQSVERTT